ncbi:MAG: sulfotransferase [Gammaproteobacteria bacterium]|nr:sulfotransferase [Gammaproteobacteria bacterium]
MFNFRNIALAFQNRFMGFDPVLNTLDTVDISNQQPIFLIGAPRSGSTAFIQAAYRCLQLSYISNLMALLPRCMVRITRIYPNAATGYKGHIMPGEFGYIPGLFSPNEAGEIMRFWFDGDRTESEFVKINLTINVITAITGNPVFLKNQTNTLRAQKIKEILPGCRFLYLYRDPIYTAQSILLARRKLGNNDMEWWSVKPPGYEKILQRDIYYQVVWQVLQLNSLCERVISNSGEHGLTIRYEHFCAEPVTIMKNLASRFSLDLRQDHPSSLNLSSANSIKLSDAEWAKLRNAHENIRSDDLDHNNYS